MNTDKRAAEIKRQWAVAVGADDPDALDDWPVEKILDLEGAERLLRWCADNNVVPQSLSEDDIRTRGISDAGCDCCAMVVNLSDAEIELFKRFFPATA